MLVLAALLYQTIVFLEKDSKNIGFIHVNIKLQNKWEQKLKGSAQQSTVLKKMVKTLFPYDLNIK